MAAALVALPVLTRGYPPMNDLPDHEEIVAAMRFFYDPTRYPPGLLTWNLGQPNQLFYYLAWLLSWLVPVRLACKIVVLGSLAGVPLGAARLATHLGRSRWIAVLVAPLALGPMFTCGLVGNLLGFGLLLALLPSIDRFAARPSGRQAAIGTACLLLLYAAHESMFTVAWLAVIVLSIGRPVSMRATAWRLTPLVVSGAIAVVEHIRAISAPNPRLKRMPQWWDTATWHKYDQMPRVLFGNYTEEALRPVYLCLCASLALVVLFGAPRVLRALVGAIGEPRRILGERFLILSIALVDAYFEVPLSINGAGGVNGRFLAPALAIAAVALGPRLPRRFPATAVLALAGVVTTCVALALVMPIAAASAVIYADLEPLLARIAPGSAVVAIDLARAPLWSLGFNTAGAAARAGAERGGRMATSFTQGSPIPAVVVAREHRWDESFDRIASNGYAFEPAADLHLYRYVLCWTFAAWQVDDMVQALSPEATLVARSGGWMLFEATGPVLPLLSPEPPHVERESLLARLEAIEHARHASRP
jgi:hypothetical protein